MTLRTKLKSMISSPARRLERTKGAKRPLNILVTGASTGFGELIAKTLGEAGHRVFASMRDVEHRNSEHAGRLRAWAKNKAVSVEVVELDVTDQGSVDRAISLIEQTANHVDVVINNAGAGGMGIVEAFSIDQMQAMFDVNTLGTMRVNKAVLPSMRRRRSGLIIHVSSTAGRIVIPSGNPYLSSKFATEALAESLYHQLAPFGVDAIILEPGYYPSTGFDQKKTQPADKQVLKEYGVDSVNDASAHEQGGNAGPDSPDPQEVADAVFDLIEMPSGKRPLRTVVGTVASAGVADLNIAYEKCKAKMLSSLGISA